MGKRGPKGKPADVKRLEGNPGCRPLPENVVEPGGDVHCPPHLTGYALTVWNEIVASMPAGVYKATDSALLAAYCTAADDLQTATFHLMIEGHVIPGVNGPRRNPWTVISSQARQQLATIGTRLGLDPMARENIKAPQSKPPASKFTGLVGINGGKA